ncbi:MAG: RidA family protein [Bryobacterales bacterium]|nr:RidA family protein [Bryobacterales bacterium]
MRRLIAATVLIFSATLVATEERIIYPPESREGMPFSAGVLVRSTLYCAGRTGSDLETSEHPAEFEQEVHQTFKRIGIILNAGGSDYSDVVDVRVYLTDIPLFQRMNSVYTQCFEKDRPIRTTAAVASLVGKARIECTVTASR